VSLPEHDIWQAFLQRLGALGVQVTYPGAHFAPPNAGVWIEAALFAVPVEVGSLAYGERAIYRGVLQAGACARPGSGNAAMQFASRVAALFEHGSSLAGATVVRPPWVGSVIARTDSVLAPVSVSFLLDKRAST